MHKGTLEECPDTNLLEVVEEQTCKEVDWVMRQSVTNNAFIRQFEQGLIRCDAFHHADHVRVAFAYLCEYSVAEALERFVVALKRFATACGKPQLYNENITRSYFALISERMAAREGSSWEEFSRRNPDLLIWRKGNLEALLSRSSQ